MGVVLVALLASAVVVVVLVTGRNDAQDIQLVTTVLGFAGTIIVVLLGLAGLGTKVETVHTAINGRMDQLVATTSTDAYQKGQAAGPGPLPETLVGPPPPVPGA
jgi:amino acid transporter